MRKACFKRLFCALLALTLLVGYAPAPAYAETSRCGENLSWRLDGNTLVIEGFGDMQNYRSGSRTPWYEQRDSITAVSLPSGLTSIGEYAFSECSNLRTVKIPDNVTKIEDDAFNGCSHLEEIVFPSGLTSIGSGAFISCSSLTSIVIPGQVKEIAYYTFGYCTNLTSVTIPNSVESIGGMAFNGCEKLISVSIPSSVTEIGISAFMDCLSLSRVKIPANVTSIQNGTFFRCYGLTDVIIPSCVTSIGLNAFYCCWNLENVYYAGTESQWNEISIDTGNDVLPGKVHFNNPCGSIHTEGIVPGKPATCTQEGLTEGKYCTVCGKILAEQVAIPAAHTEETISGYPATCTENGLSDGKRCTVCGETTLEQMVIPSGHRADKVTVKKATLTEAGIKEHYECSGCEKWFTTKDCTKVANKDALTIAAVGKVKLSDTSYSYDGKVKRPAVGVYDANGTKLKKDTDYTVTYAKGRKSVGKYNVTVKGIGNYSFKMTLTFKINPPKSAVYTPKAQSKGFTAKWVKKTSQVTGYQLQYALSSDFSDAKTVTIKDNTTVSKTVKGLKSKKTYYVRIRTYKVVGSSKFYSSWSSAKSVKTK